MYEVDYVRLEPGERRMHEQYLIIRRLVKKIWVKCCVHNKLLLLPLSQPKNYFENDNNIINSFTTYKSKCDIFNFIRLPVNYPCFVINIMIKFEPIINTILLKKYEYTYNCAVVTRCEL